MNLFTWQPGRPTRRKVRCRSARGMVIALTLAGGTSWIATGCSERPLPPPTPYDESDVSRLRETLGLETTEDEGDSPENGPSAESDAGAPTD